MVGKWPELGRDNDEKRTGKEEAMETMKDLSDKIAQFIPHWVDCSWLLPFRLCISHLMPNSRCIKVSAFRSDLTQQTPNASPVPAVVLGTGVQN